MFEYISQLPRPKSGPRRLAILGATGSIGDSALSVVAEHPERFEVAALAGARNTDKLARAAAAFRPAHLGVLDAEGAGRLREALPAGYAPEIHVGKSGYETLAALDEVDTVLSAIVGAAGLAPTFAAVAAGKDVSLANKESLVLAGHLIRDACRQSGATILPVDSEHNALFQAVVHEDAAALDTLVLTASGGPFRERSREFLASVTPAQALDHPNWSMGAKISIDSATLMNKGLEVIEACHLFGLPEDKVETVVHPQSIVHSLARYTDGSLLAHLGPPDMRVAIAYCLCWPERAALPVPRLDLAEIGALTFEKPRLDVFPALTLCREALRAGPSYLTVLNAANEVAVELFLAERIAFTEIAAAIERALDAHQGAQTDSVAAVLELDRATRARLNEQYG